MTTEKKINRKQNKFAPKKESVVDRVFKIEVGD